jgi:hypothetical protein
VLPYVHAPAPALHASTHTASAHQPPSAPKASIIRLARLVAVAVAEKSTKMGDEIIERI